MVVVADGWGGLLDNGSDSLIQRGLWHGDANMGCGARFLENQDAKQNELSEEGVSAPSPHTHMHAQTSPEVLVVCLCVWGHSCS